MQVKIAIEYGTGETTTREAVAITGYKVITLPRETVEWAYKHLIEGIAAEPQWRTKELADQATERMTAIAQSLGLEDRWTTNTGYYTDSGHQHYIIERTP